MIPIITITGSIVLNALILRKVLNLQASHLSLLLSLLNIFIYIRSPVYYTHTLVVFFLPATLYTYLLLVEADTKRKIFFMLISFALMASFSYIIRATGLAVAIAILFDNIFRFEKEKALKAISGFLLCGLFILSYFGY